MNFNKGLLQSTFEHRSPLVALSMFEDANKTIKTVVGRFSHKIRILDPNSYYDRSTAANNFLSNVHGSLAISSFSSATPQFVTGQMNLPSMEIPAFDFSYYELAVFVYFKIKTIYGHTAEVSEFRFHVDVPYEVSIDLDTESLDTENPYIDEVTWVAAMNQLDEPENATEEEVAKCEETRPWWRRPTGEMRDFFNYVDMTDPEHMDNLIAYSIDLGIDLQNSIEQEEKRKRDMEVAKTIAEDYRKGAELPDEVLKEISGLVETLGLDINEVLDSITDGTLFEEADTEESEFVERMIEIYEGRNGNPDDGDDDNQGPTVVSL